MMQDIKETVPKTFEQDLRAANIEVESAFFCSFEMGIMNVIQK